MSISKRDGRLTLLKILEFPKAKKSLSTTFDNEKEEVVDIILCNYGEDYHESIRYQVHIFGFKKRKCWWKFWRE